MAVDTSGVLSPEQFRTQYAELAQEVADRATAETKLAKWLKTKQGKYGASSGWTLWTPTLQEANNLTLRKYIKRKAAECDGLQRGEIRAGSTRHGNDEELPGAEDFMDRSGLTLTHYGDDQQWVAWEECDQVGCTPDGLIFCRSVMLPWLTDLLENVTLVFEQKNNDTIEAYEEFAGMTDGSQLLQVNYKYWIQCQHQMMCLKSPAAVFQARYSRTESGEADMCWFLVPRDDEFIERHGARLKRAVKERDAQREVRAGRRLVDLTSIITQ